MKQTLEPSPLSPSPLLSLSLTEPHLLLQQPMLNHHKQHQFNLFVLEQLAKSAPLGLKSSRSNIKAAILKIALGRLHVQQLY